MSVRTNYSSQQLPHLDIITTAGIGIITAGGPALWQQLVAESSFSKIIVVSQESENNISDIIRVAFPKIEDI